MKLNNEPVFIGDRVFDISAQRGFGSVIRVTSEYLEVKFQRVSVRYDAGGVQIGKDWQTLFWEKPLIIQPTKEEHSWVEKRSMIQDFYQLMTKYKGLF